MWALFYIGGTLGLCALMFHDGSPMEQMIKGLFVGITLFGNGIWWVVFGMHKRRAWQTGQSCTCKWCYTARGGQ